MSEYTLHWKNRFTRGQSPINGDADCSIPFPFLAQDTENKIVQYWTGEQVTKMFSALKTGADLMFPEAANDILWWFLKGIHCPPTVDPDGEGCVEYLPSASFIKFFPDNPYIAGDTSAGWNKEAWFTWPQFDTLFPDWFDNWLNGAISSLTNYQATDVLFNLESIPINPIDAFLNGGGTLPKIEINFSGSGELTITLLSFPLGGKAIIELDQEPNILDILTGGLLDPAAFMVELNRDILNFPPDEYPIVQIPLSVPTTGNHTLYICYIPTLDDSLIPVAFGGGFRSVEFCGFPEQGNMGIEQIVWDGCQLKTVTNGIETVIVTASQIEACLDIPEPSGGGSPVSAKVTVYEVELSANDNNSSTSYQKATDSAVMHAFTGQNALIIANAAHRNTVAGEASILQIGIEGFFGLNPSPQRLIGDVTLISTVSQIFNGEFAPQPQEIAIWHKQESGGTSRVSTASTIRYTIFEYTDGSEIFVQDIRIFEGELQKKIGGVWIPVTDSFEAIIQSLQSQVSAAAANAASAVSTSNNALTVAQGAVNVNNTQNTRLNALEAFQEDAELSLSQLSLTINDHETRIDALEAASGATLKWETYYDFMTSDNGWSGNPWVSGQGFQFGNGLPLLLGKASITVFDSRVEMIEVEISQHNAIEDFTISFPISSNEGTIRLSSGGFTFNWLAVPAMQIPYTPVLRMPNPPLATRYLRKLRVIGFGSFNPFI